MATVAKKILTKLFAKVKVLNRPDGTGDSLGSSLSSIIGLVIWVFGLMAVLNLFRLNQVTAPLQNMLSTLLHALPQILGAAIVLFIGFVLAKIVREVVVTALQAANVDRFAEKFSKAGNRIDSATAPAPRSPTHNSTWRVTSKASVAHVQAQGRAGHDGSEPMKISSMIGMLVFAVVVLVVAISALQILGIKSISGPASHMLKLILDTIPLIIGAAILLAIGGRVIFGAVIIMAGVFVAGLLAEMVSGRTGDIVTTVLFAAIGLRYMGLANSVINLAFGAVVVGGAATAALAFGLGGREAAARQLEKMQHDAAASKAPTTTTTDQL